MKKLWLLCALLCALPTFATQNLTTVTASDIQDLSGQKLATGRLCFLGTDGNDLAINFHIGGGGTVTKQAFCTTVTNGAITSFTVPDPGHTAPGGINYRVTAVSGSGQEVLRYKNVTFSGATFNLDSYAPTGIISAPFGSSIPGPVTVLGDLTCTGSTCGSASSVSVSNDASLGGGSPSTTAAPSQSAAQTYVGTGLAGKANTSHNHAGTDITSGTINSSRVVTGTITKGKCLHTDATSGAVTETSDDCGSGSGSTPDATLTTKGKLYSIDACASFTCDGSTDQTSAFNSYLTGLSTAPTRVLFSAQMKLGTITIPTTVSLDGTAGGGITCTSGDTVTVNGPLLASAQTFFQNCAGTGVSGNGAVDFTGEYRQNEYQSEWWGANYFGTAAANTPAVQQAIIGALGNTRTNAGTAHLRYNRPLLLPSLYSINDEIKAYHWIGFKLNCGTRLNAGINQTQTNKRILDGQSIAYGGFFNCQWQSTASQDATHPLIDLDYDTSQGSDLAPQFIDFTNNSFFGNTQTAYGVLIAKSGGGAQGSNINFWNPAFQGFTTAALQIGLAGHSAQNAIQIGVFGGDFQTNHADAIQNVGGSFIPIFNTTFENGYGQTQTGYDLDNVGGVGGIGFIGYGIRSESMRLLYGSAHLYDSQIVNQDNKWNTLGSSGTLNTYITGTDKCGDGSPWYVSTAGSYGGIRTAQTATGGSSTTIVNSGASYTVNAFIGYRACVLSGTGVNNYCVVTGNTSTTLTCSAGWVSNYQPAQISNYGTAPDSTSTFVVEPDWATIASPFTTGTAVITKDTRKVVDTCANCLLDNVFLNGLQVSPSGSVVRFNGVTTPRKDWLSSASGFPYSNGGLGAAPIFRNVRVIRGTEGPFAWQYPHNSGGNSWYLGPTPEYVGGSVFVFSAGKSGGGQSANDCTIGGRSDPDALNSASRNILEIGNGLTQSCPIGPSTPYHQTDASGVQMLIQGGLPTGAGTPGSIKFMIGSTGSTGQTITDGTVRWYFDGATAHFFAATDNTNDIGASGANRPRTGYFGTSIVAPTVNATTAFQFNGSPLLANANQYCSDAGSNDTYACDLAPAIASYATGLHYRFKANTANTGAATINFNSLGAKTIKKAAGGITTDLADNDIRAGQWVDVVYDGSNMQMQSTLGNAGSSSLTLAGSSGDLQTNGGSGNLGSVAQSTFVPATRTVNTHALSGNITLAFGDLTPPANNTAVHFGSKAAGGSNYCDWKVNTSDQIEFTCPIKAGTGTPSMQGTPAALPTVAAGDAQFGIDGDTTTAVFKVREVSGGTTGSATEVMKVNTAVQKSQVPTVTMTVDTSTPVTVSTTLAAEFHVNEHATAATAMVYNLPTAAAGKQFCFANGYNGSNPNTGTVKIATSASGQFIIWTDGTLSASGGYGISGGAAGDAACVVGVDSTHWIVYVNRGTWTKN